LTNKIDRRKKLATHIVVILKIQKTKIAKFFTNTLHQNLTFKYIT